MKKKKFFITQIISKGNQEFGKRSMTYMLLQLREIDLSSLPKGKESGIIICP